MVAGEEDSDIVARPTPVDHDVRHDTFTVVRHFDVPVGAVFSAFEDDQIRRRWFRIPGAVTERRHVFRVGGGEDTRSTFSAPDVEPELLHHRSRYLDIVPDRRIVFVYETIIDDVVRWASLVTVVLAAGEGGTDLSWTEQVTFLGRHGDGGADFPHLRGGTNLRLNGLTAALGSTT